MKPETHKTVYIKFAIQNGNGEVEPQKGSFNKTTDGYSLSKNIKTTSMQQKISQTEPPKYSQKPEQTVSPTTLYANEQPLDLSAYAEELNKAMLEPAPPMSNTEILDRAWAVFPEAYTMRQTLSDTLGQKQFPIDVWYAVLGVSRGASMDIVNEAYTNLALKWNIKKNIKAGMDPKLANEILEIVKEARRQIRHYDQEPIKEAKKATRKTKKATK